MSVRKLLSAIQLVASLAVDTPLDDAYLRAVTNTYAATPDRADNAKVLEKARKLAGP